MSDFLDIQYIKGVGPQVAKRLHRLGVFNTKDFLFFFPRTYDDRRFLPKINELKPNQSQSCYGVIRSVSETKTKTRKSIITALISDQTGNIQAVWFNQPYLLKVLKPGIRLFIKGKLERNAYTGQLQISVSDTEIIRDQDDYQKTIGSVIPIYPLVSGLNQQQIRKISRQVINDTLSKIPDSIPDYIINQMQLKSLRKAVEILHFPKSLEEYHTARYRIVFDEFFFFQLALGLKKNKVKTDLKASPLKTSGLIFDAYLNVLPYQYTSSQKACINDIFSDLSSTKPMNRLLQGDVGSGKTEVAVMSLLAAIESGKKGVIMAPTQILAEQHFFKFQRYLEPLGVPIFLLKGKMRKKEKEQVLSEISQEIPMIVVGTHALIEEPVMMKNLAVAVIDEQHRFGVLQRMLLHEKGETPHCLFMTATPIPRSFMLTCFGDLDKSIMDGMPPGRIPPQTYFAKEHHLHKVFEQCRKEIHQGQQLFVVYPLVEESEKLDLQSAIEESEHIQSNIYPEFKVGLLHGRMNANEKTRIMDAFKQNEIQVLVSTTVIEVGIDVPNATMIIIQHAERFGLSQLHQLRGRIGRSTLASSCYLIANPKTDSGKKRIQAMIETTDGFKIAEYDLLIRGPGDMLGTRQAGLPDFKLADIIKDEKVLIAARKMAFSILKKDPILAAKEHYWMKKELMENHDMFKGQQLN